IRDKLVTGVQTCALPISSFGTSKIARAEKAEQATPDKALNDAKEAFETAQTFFVRGEYDTAAAKFLEAYNKKPFPAFLFNVAVRSEERRVGKECRSRRSE